MFNLAAELFAEVAKEITKEFGKEGEEAIRRGVRNFGKKRGESIARRAAADGKSNTIENYLPYYDMERSELFQYDTEESEDTIDQHFYQCPFAETWIKNGDQKYGKLYCDEVDDAISKGFNPCLTHTCHTHLLYGDSCCHMSFTLKKTKKP